MCMPRLGRTLGLGLAIGMGHAVLCVRFHAEYEFQRIDREVGANDVPIQLSLARVGVSFGF